jgi:hypothetical protein
MGAGFERNVEASIASERHGNRLGGYGANRLVSQSDFHSFCPQRHPSENRRLSSATLPTAATVRATGALVSAVLFIAAIATTTVATLRPVRRRSTEEKQREYYKDCYREIAFHGSSPFA